MTSLKFRGNRIYNSFAVRLNSSWSGPAIGNPTRDCINASIPKVIASGPSLEPPSLPPGKNRAMASVRWTTANICSTG